MCAGDKNEGVDVDEAKHDTQKGRTAVHMRHGERRYR